jgi:hypothetical protein
VFNVIARILFLIGKERESKMGKSLATSIVLTGLGRWAVGGQNGGYYNYSILNCVVLITIILVSISASIVVCSFVNQETSI